jgi:hypothetical protein
MGVSEARSAGQAIAMVHLKDWRRFPGSMVTANSGDSADHTHENTESHNSAH